MLLARLMPGSSGSDELTELEHEGLVRRGTMKLPKDFLDAPRPKAATSVTQALLEERQLEI